MQQYILRAWDGTDEAALERRMSSRPAHLERAGQLKTNGNYILGGALLNKAGTMVGSVMIVQFASPEALQEWMDTEPYITGKVWEKIDIQPFRVAGV